jgi:hypothetical protein
MDKFTNQTKVYFVVSLSVRMMVVPGNDMMLFALNLANAEVSLSIEKFGSFQNFVVEFLRRSLLPVTQCLR